MDLPFDDVAPPPPHGAPADPFVDVEPAQKQMSRTTKILIAVAASLIVLGIVLKFIEPSSSGEMTASGAGGANLVDAQGNPIPGQPQGEPEPDWAPGFLKMGFSFFVCFAMGYAGRKFVKIGLLIAGVVFAIFFVGAYLDILQLKVDVMERHWNTFLASAKTQFDSFKAFLTGSLPAAGFGAMGLFTGFRQG